MAKATVALAVLGGGLYLTATLVVQAAVDLETVARWVEPRAAAALPGTVTIDGAGITLFPRPSLDARGVTVQSGDTIEGPSVLRVARVRLQLEFLALMTGELRVARVVLDGPVMSPTGSDALDLGGLLARSAPPALDSTAGASTPAPPARAPLTGVHGALSPPEADTAFH